MELQQLLVALRVSWEKNPRATSGQEENDSGRSGSFWRKLQASTGELRRRTEVEPEVDSGPEIFHFSNFHNFCIRARIHARFILLGSYRNFRRFDDGLDGFGDRQNFEFKLNLNSI